VSFFDDVVRVFETAEGGREPAEVGILVDDAGLLRIVEADGWCPEALQAHYGARTVYQVTRGRDEVRVAARSGRQTCMLSSVGQVISLPASAPQAPPSGALAPPSGELALATQETRFPAPRRYGSSGGREVFSTLPASPSSSVIRLRSSVSPSTWSSESRARLYDASALSSDNCVAISARWSIMM
jgi:hypothetical protein